MFKVDGVARLGVGDGMSTVVQMLSAMLWRIVVYMFIWCMVY
jgi:hypothetical protein